MRFTQKFLSILLIGVLVVTILFFEIPIGHATAYTDSVGGTSGTGGGATGYIFAFQLTASNSGTLTSVGIDIASGAAAHVRTAIYADTGSNVPASVLGQSTSTSAVNGWNDLTISNVTITAGTKYWLAYQTDSDANVFYHTGTNIYEISQVYGTFPTSPSWSYGAGWNINYMRMNYSSASTVSITFTSTPTGIGYITVNGSAQTTPYTIATATVGDHYTIAANSPVAVTWGNQYVYNSWSDSGAQSHVYTVSVAATVTASFTQQLYNLTGIPVNQVTSINGVPISGVQSVNGVP